MSEASANDAVTLLFERLVAPWRDDLYRYAFWLCRDPSLADDVVQEAMFRAFKSLGSLKDEAVVKTWLLTIVRREHARVYERKRLDTRDIDDLSAAEAALIASRRRRGRAVWPAHRGRWLHRQPWPPSASGSC